MALHCATFEELASDFGGSGCCVYSEQAKSTAGVAGKHRYAIQGPNCVDGALLAALQHLKAASGLGFPNPHRAVMGGRENMALIVTPGDRSNCVAVLLKYPQALACLRIPEPDIAGA